MLVCYLDDSGKDRGNRITTIAGYAATDNQWKAFELEVEPIFAEYGINILHAIDLHGTRGEFKGWSVLRKQAFVAKLCGTLARHALLGVSMSALKDTYRQRAAQSGRKRTVTPYTFCSNVLINWVLRDILVGRVANAEGLGFILEAGNEHNAEAKWNFNEVRRQHQLEGVLHFIEFISKASCRAIQMADLFAFYSRRHGGEIERARGADRPRVQKAPGIMLNIITERLPHRAFVATDFGPEAGLSPSSPNPTFGKRSAGGDA